MGQKIKLFTPICFFILCSSTKVYSSRTIGLLSPVGPLANYKKIHTGCKKSTGPGLELL